MHGTRFRNCTLAGIGGVTSFDGAIVDGRDLAPLAYSLGIRIEGTGGGRRPVHRRNRRAHVAPPPCRAYATPAGSSGCPVAPARGTWDTRVGRGRTHRRRA